MNDMQRTIQIAGPAVLGMVGLYLLLPGINRIPRWIGMLAGLAAFGLAGSLLSATAQSVSWVGTGLFIAFGSLALLGAVQLVTQPNPARGAVAFALVVINVCGLFLLNGAPFLAAATIIIYAGAIVVTFLFVIMLCQQHGESDADARSREPLLSCAAGALLLGLLFGLITRQYDAAPLRSMVAAVDAALALDRPTTNEIEDAFTRIPSAWPIKEAVERKLDETVARVRALGDNDVAARQQLTALRAELIGFQARTGDIPPPDAIPLSRYGANQTGDRRLPVGNVASIGRVVYSDYVLGVEMAGTLLLVATIGAIAITYRTGRRPA
jgi:NADH:ubiquinone oxidoreductase subunit 6 (subunit J)